MSLFNTLDVTASALSAQSIRLNTIASNLANAESVAGSAEETYRERMPVFQALYEELSNKPGLAGVRVMGIIEGTEDPLQQYSPEHPLADSAGYIYKPSINVVEQMANMMSASQSFKANIEAMNTYKQLMQQTIQLGNS